jgi:hypothetical protein
MFEFLILLAVIFVALCSAPTSFAQASDVYITPDGSGQGVCTNSPQPPSFFNNSGNWGTGANQIGPGTTVHLCGTFSTTLALQGSGNSASPVTVLFESGAIFSAPFWGSSGAISVNNLNYILVDGGTNGMIEATANGTGLANQQDGKGISITNCSNCEVRNLTVANIYVHTSNSSDESGEGTYGIYYAGGSNVLVHDNSVHDAKWCAFYAYSTGATASNVSIYSNNLAGCDHGVVVGGGNSNAAVSGVSVHSNVIHDGGNWDDNQNNNHHDGIHVWAVIGGDVITGLQVFDNKIYGDWGTHMNAHIFVEANSGGTDNGWMVYNNSLTLSVANHFPAEGYIYCQGNNGSVYSNSILNPSNANTTGINLTGSLETVENNLVSSVATGIYIPSGASLSSSDYNLFYNLSGNAMVYQGKFFNTPSSWISGTGFDSHSVLTNPQVDTNFQITTASSAHQAALNLDSLDVSNLDLDAAGNPRPSGTSKWDIGAFQAGGTSGSQPNPPSNLNAVIN